MKRFSNAFSLVEALVTLMIVSIVLAAVMPVMSRRVSTPGSIWQYVSSGKGANFDAYFGIGSSQSIIVGASALPDGAQNSKLVLVTADDKNDTIQRSILDFEQSSDDGIVNIGKVSFDQKANTAVGKSALSETNTGMGNTAVGHYSLGNNTAGTGNTALGGETLMQNTNGVGNIAIGYQAGYAISGSKNICIGPQSGGNDGNNQLFIDTAAKGQGSLIYGDFTNGTIKINGDLTTATGSIAGNSDRRLKNVLGKSNDSIEKINKVEVKKFTYKKDKKHRIHVGVVAQELQQIFPNSVHKGSDGYLTVDRDEMFFAMLNSIKYLYKENQKLKYENKELKSQINEINARLDRLETK